MPEIIYTLKNIKISASPSIDCNRALVKKEFNQNHEIEFKPEGAFVQIGKDYQQFFIHLFNDSCQLDTCSLREASNCDQILSEVGSNIKIGPSPTFGIFANEKNWNGYKAYFCLRCVLKDKENKRYEIDYDKLVVKAAPLDCPKYARKRSHEAIQIPFDSKGLYAPIATNETGTNFFFT